MEKDTKEILKDMMISNIVTELTSDLLEGIKCFDDVTKEKYKKQLDIISASLDCVAQQCIIDLKLKYKELDESADTLSIQTNLMMQRLEKFYEENYKETLKETEIYVKKNIG